VIAGCVCGSYHLAVVVIGSRSGDGQGVNIKGGLCRDQDGDGGTIGSSGDLGSLCGGGGVLSDSGSGGGGARRGASRLPGGVGGRETVNRDVGGSSSGGAVIGGGASPLRGPDRRRTLRRVSA
jgi:hypothetical protein